MFNKKGFSLIEIMLGIIIFSIIIVAGFDAMGSIVSGKIKLVEKADINKEAYFFSERLFEEIKKGGTIDYEEYFNRRVVGTATNSGYYSAATGFGNYGSGGNILTATFGTGFYYCLSSTFSMGTGGCVTGYNNGGGNHTGKFQRYGQYQLQHFDYNSDKNNDKGDVGGVVDGDGNFRGDDDDENLGEGPETFTGGTDVKELYLISGDGKKRTFFRRSVIIDPKKPSTATCDTTATGSGCLGTIEFLKLDGKDWGIDHSKSGTGAYDGIVDTWIVDPLFTGGSEVIAGSGNYRQKMFSDDINVKSFKIYPYPNKNRKYAWKDFSNTTNISPYVRIELILTPSWKKRSAIKGTPPDIKIATTINLVDYFSK